METIQARLARFAQDAELSIHNSYSGRGMYGRACVGLGGSEESVMRVVGEVIAGLMDDIYNAAIDAEDDDEMRKAIDITGNAQEMVSILLDYKRDSLGFECIVYWPKIEPSEALEEMSDAWIDVQSASVLQTLVRDNPAHISGDDDVNTLEGLRATVKLMRDRMDDDHP